MSKLSYKKLFKMLIDIDMSNTELIEKAGISKSTFYKMKNGENITTDVLLRVCDVLKCDVSDNSLNREYTRLVPSRLE